MKNKGLIITMIVILCIIAVSLIALLYFIISGKYNLNFGFYRGKKSENIIYDETYDINNINQIEIISSAGDIKFEESTDENIRILVYGETNKRLRVDFNEKRLKVDHSERNNWSLFKFNMSINDIIIYIPKNYDKDIKLDLDYGNIKVLDLEQATIDIKEDYGDIDLGKIKNVTIKNDYGSVKIEEVLNKLNIETDCGDVKIDKLELLESSKIKVDLGSVKIKQTNNIYFDTNVDFGDEKINNNNRNSETTLKIEVDCGDIKIEN